MTQHFEEVLVRIGRPQAHCTICVTHVKYGVRGVLRHRGRIAHAHFDVIHCHSPHRRVQIGQVPTLTNATKQKVVAQKLHVGHLMQRFYTTNLNSLVVVDEHLFLLSYSQTSFVMKPTKSSLNNFSAPEIGHI